MGQVRPLNIQFERYVLRWRTYRGGTTAERYLNLLAVPLEPRGWRLIRLYRSQGFPLPGLWVYASGPDDHVGLGVVVLAVSGVPVFPPVSNVESGGAPGRCRVEVGPVRDGARRSAQIDLDAVFGEHLHEGVEGDGWRVLMMVVARDEVLAGHRRVIPDQSERSRSAPLPA